MSSTIPETTTIQPPGERADLVAELGAARHFLRFTARGLDDQQARRRTTVSTLTIGGLIKHVAATERQWAAFAVSGPPAAAAGPKAFGDWTEEDFAEYAKGFTLLPGETLVEALADYAAIAAATDEMVRTLPSLDTMHPLPAAPWFTETAWSARRAIIHIIAETTQHAGHADIIRESLDGQKTMG